MMASARSNRKKLELKMWYILIVGFLCTISVLIFRFLFPQVVPQMANYFVVESKSIYLYMVIFATIFVFALSKFSIELMRNINCLINNFNKLNLTFGLAILCKKVKSIVCVVVIIALSFLSLYLRMKPDILKKINEFTYSHFKNVDYSFNNIHGFSIFIFMFVFICYLTYRLLKAYEKYFSKAVNDSSLKEEGESSFIKLKQGIIKIIQNNRKIALIFFSLTLIMMNNMFIDVVLIFFPLESKSAPHLFSFMAATSSKNSHFIIYGALFGIIAFAVTTFVAYVRFMGYQQAQEQLNHTQKQFGYAKLKDAREEVEKRFQEGVGFLSSEHEIVRLNGIGILWKIVENAVKALPYRNYGGDVHYFERKNKVASHILHGEDENGEYFEEESIRLESLNEDGELKTTIFIYMKNTEDTHDEYSSDTAINSKRNQKNKANDEKQSILKERYNKNVVTDFEKNIYKKSFDLHKEILNILCRYIYIRTNDKNYLKEFYPSIYRLRYAQDFSDNCKDIEEQGYLEVVNEKPSYDIQLLLDLLTKKPDLNLVYDSSGLDIDAFFGENKYQIPNYALDFKLNLDKAILKGANCDDAYFEGASCKETNFDVAKFNKVSFKNTNCNYARFKGANFKGTLFSNVFLKNTFFQYSICEATYFENTKCENANFTGSTFLSIYLPIEQCSGKEILGNTIFNGLNSKLGGIFNISNANINIVFSSLKSAEPISNKKLIPDKYANFKIFRMQLGIKGEIVPIKDLDINALSEAYSCESLLKQGVFRIFISDIADYIEFKLGKDIDREQLEILLNFKIKYLNFKNEHKKENDLNLLFQQFTDEEKELSKEYFLDFDEISKNIVS